MSEALHEILKPYGANAACLPEILDALGWQGDVRRLAESVPVLLHGRRFDKVDMLNILANLGYDAKRIKPRAWREEEVNVFLPTAGSPRLLRGEPGDRERGQIYRITKREAEDTADRFARQKTNLGWMRLLTYRMGRIFAQVAALSAFSMLFSLAVPFYVMLTYDKVIGTEATGTLPALTLCALILLGAEACCFGLRVWTGAWFSAKVGQEVGTATFERILALPAIFTERATPASQILRLKAFEAARDFFGGPMLQAVLDAPFVLILIAVLGIIGGPLAFVPVGLAVAYCLMLVTLRSKLAYAGHRHARAHSERQQLANETFTRLETIHAGGMAAAWGERLVAGSKKATNAATRHNFYTAAVEHGSHALLLLAIVTTLTIGIYRVWDNAMTVGGLIATMILIWRVLGPLHTLCTLTPRFAHVRQAIIQIDKLMALPPEPGEQDQHAFRGVADKPAEIAFSQVALRYGRAQDPVFSGLNTTVEPGEIIAVTGSNGVGKSSILKLVQGLYSPIAGSIRLDGADIRQLDPVALRRRVAYLPQAPQFITASIFENLRLGRAALTEADAFRALAQADATEAVLALPEGIHTIIGPRLPLPAGIAQRLHLARLYMGKEKVLLIDEQPNPLLDSDAGQRFLFFLNGCRGERTVLFVTHREDHLRLADRILWLRADRQPTLGRLNTPKNPTREQRELIHA